MTIKRFNLDEGHIWEAIEGLSPYKTTMTLEGVVEKLNSLCEENEQLRQELNAQKSLCNYYRMKYKELLDGVQENLKGELVIK